MQLNTVKARDGLWSYQEFEIPNGSFEEALRPAAILKLYLLDHSLTKIYRKMKLIS
jgi:hypothetical protein